MDGEKTMKIEVLEPGGFKHSFDGGRTPEFFEEGDIRSVPFEHGEYFCKLGWAKDVSGEVETGERRTDRVVHLEINNTAHKTTSPNIGG